MWGKKMWIYIHSLHFACDILLLGSASEITPCSSPQGWECLHQACPGSPDASVWPLLSACSRLSDWWVKGHPLRHIRPAPHLWWGWRWKGALTCSDYKIIKQKESGCGKVNKFRCDWSNSCKRWREPETGAVGRRTAGRSQKWEAQPMGVTDESGAGGRGRHGGVNCNGNILYFNDIHLNTYI